MISILGNQLLTESYGSNIEDITLESPEKYGRDNGLHVAIQESYQDIVSIYEAIAVLDIQNILYKQKTGTLMESTVVMEGFKERVTEIWKKIKEWITKLWNKIKVFFKNLIVRMQSLFMSGKDFVNKYKKELEKVKSKKVTIKNTFKYDMKNLFDKNSMKDMTSMLLDGFNDIITLSKEVDKKANNDQDTSKYLESAKEKIAKMKESEDEKLDDARAMMANVSGKLDSSEYAEALKVSFQGGDRVPGDKQFTVSEAMDFLLKDYGKKVKEFESEFNNVCAAINRQNDTMKNTAEKFENSDLKSIMIELASYVSTFSSKVITIMNTYVSVWKTTVNSANAVMKKVCVRAAVQKYDE